MCALIEKNCNVKYSEYCPDGFTIACKKGYTKLVEKMLQYPSISNLLHKDLYNSPLIETCRKGFMDIFDLLIHAGADPNKPNSKYFTPLMSACFYNNIDIVKRLLAMDVNVNAQDEYGCTALHGCKSTEILHQLYIYGADFTITTKTGTTPLHNISIEAEENYVKSLIEYMPQCINNVNERGNTPLINIICRGCNEINIIKLFLEAGADINIRNNDGRTASYYAINNKNCDDEFLQLLLPI